MVELFDVQLLRLLEFQLWQLYRLFVQLRLDIVVRVTRIVRPDRRTSEGGDGETTGHRSGRA